MILDDFAIGLYVIHFKIFLNRASPHAGALEALRGAAAPGAVGAPGASAPVASPIAQGGA